MNSLKFELKFQAILQSQASTTELSIIIRIYNRNQNSNANMCCS